MSGRRNRNPEKPPTRGRVLRVGRERGLVWIEGVNRHVHHLKPGPRHPKGGRLEREAGVRLSKVMIVTADGVPVRLARALRDKDGKVTARPSARTAAK